MLQYHNQMVCQGMQNKLKNKESMEKGTEEQRAEDHGQ